LFAGFIIAQPDTVAARSPTLYHSGSLCNPKTTADFNKISYSEYGAQNNSTSTAATVVCGTVLPHGIETALNVFAYDRHATQDVCCTGVLQDISGDVFATRQDCTEGSSAGIRMATLDFMDADADAHSVTVNVECSIPPKVGSSLSHVAFFDNR
jgi:hypothetical protein